MLEIKFMMNILFSARSFVHRSLTRQHWKNCKTYCSVTDKLIWMISLKAFKVLPILVADQNKLMLCMKFKYGKKNLLFKRILAYM